MQLTLLLLFGLLAARPFGFIVGNDMNNTALGAQTRFLGVGDGTTGTAEANKQFSVPRDCTAHAFYVVTGSAQGGDGAMVFTLRDVTNAADTALSVTVAASSAAGFFSNTATSVALIAGTGYTLRVVNAATTSASMKSWVFKCD